MALVQILGPTRRRGSPGDQAKRQRQGGQDQPACRGRRPSPPPRRNEVTNNTPNSTRYGSTPALGQLRSVT
jgi:hypothetical protein